MKKFNLAIAIALGFSIPFSVMSAGGNDGNQQDREMQENSTESVMQRKALPEQAADKVTEDATYRHRFIKRLADEVEGKGKQTQQGGKQQTGDGSGEGEMDRDRTRDQDQSQIHDQEQDRDRDRDQDRTMQHDMDQIRDTDHEFEHEPSLTRDNPEDPPMEQEQHEPEEPGKNQQGS